MFGLVEEKDTELHRIQKTDQEISRAQAGNRKGKSFKSTCVAPTKRAQPCLCSEGIWHIQLCEQVLDG